MFSLSCVQNFCYAVMRSKIFIVQQNFHCSSTSPQILCPLRSIIRTDPSQILPDSISTFPLHKKSPKHIAAVSQDEQIMLVADVGALIFRLGVSLLSLAHFWPLGESPVLAGGMLRLTCLVTPTLTPTAALHSMLGIWASSHRNSLSICELRLLRAVCPCM